MWSDLGQGGWPATWGQDGRGLVVSRTKLRTSLENASGSLRGRVYFTKLDNHIKYPY